VTDVLAAAAAVVLLVGALVFLAWAAYRVRRRGGGASLMSPFDEIWHPAAHEVRLQQEQRQEQPTPAPLPGGRWRLRR
jgi:hypothetical protein